MTKDSPVQLLMILDFDPKSVKVSTLRGILSENSIEYPSNAKKNELIAIFNEQLKPQSGKLLKKWEDSINTYGKKDDFINVSSEVIKNLKDVDSPLDTSADVIMLSSDEEHAKKPKRVYKSKREKKVKKSPEDDVENGKGKKSEKNKEISESKTKKSDKQSKQNSAEDSEVNVKPKKSKKTKAEDEEKPKKARKLKAEADESKEELKPKKSKITSEADESIEIQPQSQGRTPDLATPESARRPRGRPRKVNPEATPSSKSFIDEFSITEEDTTTNNSNFECDNVFQSGGNSSTSTPSSKKKRHLDEEVEDRRKAKKKHTGESPSTKKEQTLAKKLEKSTASYPNETEERTPTLKHESPASSAKTTPRVKKAAESPASSTKAFTEKTPSEKTTPLKFSDIVNDSGKKSRKSTPRSVKTSTPSKSTNLKDETKSFDEALRKIKNEANVSQSMKADEEIVLNNQQVDLMKQTGIIIEDLRQENLVSSPLKPRLRTIREKKQPIEDQVDDEEESDEEEESETAITPPRTKVSLFKVFKVFSFLFLWVSLISFSLFGYWYREQQYLIGYCGLEIDIPTIPKHAGFPPIIEQLGELLDDKLKPSCIKCPPHARCFTNLEIGCYDDFIEYKPWYFDYSPILDRSLKKCVPDTKKAEKLEIMIDVALDLLRSKNADKNCGKSPVESIEGGLESTELHDLLLAMKAPYITEEEFEELWSRALVELEKEPEIIVRQVY